MSAFVVEHDTIDRCVRAMTVSDSTEAERTELGRKLLTMNCEAVAVRYREPADLATVEAYTYTSRASSLSPHQQLKSLKCLRYQCSESDAIESSDLYSKVTDAIHRIAIDIATSTPEYQAAEWS